MKTVARITLKVGDMLGEDIFSNHGEKLYSAGTKLDHKALDRLARHNIMAVTIMEDIDFAETHTERVKLSDDFKQFRKVYYEVLPQFRGIIDNIVDHNIAPPMDQLMGIYVKLASNAKNGDTLLDYLRNIPPDVDNMLYEHQLNCGLIASVFGSWQGMSKADMFTLIQCAFLYDIGKLCLPRDLLYKPSKLTDEEFETMKTHTTLGHDLLNSVGLSGPVALSALQHHEKGDGTGYPNKLNIGQIDDFAQYCSIIDAYEAMSVPKTYRYPLNTFEIISNFEKDGYKFNKFKLNSILYNIAKSQMGLHAKLTDGSEGEVILINQVHISRPMIKDVNGNLIDMNTLPDSVSIYALF
ncbi:HD-GYP domain, c-di-GMP phosphodiesterase class II (or its inactivated variant) [Lachnospiraceae bacterium XBB2008]|nr:HD-GYP domain, c-di-GMP phosphodiesterase class II (or its inactivated variant) [Lachnospiraceae bacterium XBB2008]